MNKRFIHCSRKSRTERHKKDIQVNVADLVDKMIPRKKRKNNEILCQNLFSITWLGLTFTSAFVTKTKQKEFYLKKQLCKSGRAVVEESEVEFVDVIEAQQLIPGQSAEVLVQQVSGTGRSI